MNNIKGKDIIVVMGKSSAGKSTFLHYLNEIDFEIKKFK
jgi:ABC-type phosphate/phosphonate transport system ATPase subunit